MLFLTVSQERLRDFSEFKLLEVLLQKTTKEPDWLLIFLQPEKTISSKQTAVVQ
jgi:hypothetical protein